MSVPVFPFNARPTKPGKIPGRTGTHRSRMTVIMDAIHLEDLAFYAYHGVYDEEARLGQRFHVDLTCWLDLTSSSVSDDYADTVCYGTLAKAVEKTVTTTRFNLIERLAGAVANTLFETDSRIQKARVRIHKPGAPLPIPAGKVSVEILRTRPGIT